MWGPSIIGFGSYHYKYESGHEGDAPLVGFSPRKEKISLYLAHCCKKRKREEMMLKDFGTHTTGKACVYINKVADIDVDELRALISPNRLMESISSLSLLVDRQNQLKLPNWLFSLLTMIVRLSAAVSIVSMTGCLQTQIKLKSVAMYRIVFKKEND